MKYLVCKTCTNLKNKNSIDTKLASETKKYDGGKFATYVFKTIMKTHFFPAFSEFRLFLVQNIAKHNACL